MDLQQVFTIHSDPFFIEEEEEIFLRELLDRLILRKISWSAFAEKVPHLHLFSRIQSSYYKRTLLHHAVLEDQFDIVRALKDDGVLKWRRDSFGLRPLDIATLLGKVELASLLGAPSPFEEVSVPDRSFIHTDHLIFETRECFEKVLLSVERAKNRDCIDTDKIWLGVYYEKEIQLGSHPQVEVRFVQEEVGFGVFAKTKIPPCSFVGEYTGIVREKNPKELENKIYALRYNVWESRSNFVIDAQEKGNFTRFFNHSNKPNLSPHSVYCRGIPRMIFLCVEEIEEGSQLTFDYGPIFWKNLDQKPIETL